MSTLRYLPVLIALTGAIARLGALAVAGGAPRGLFELIEQAWLGAAWGCAIIGLGLAISTGRTHTLIIGLVQVLVGTLWSLVVEWPMATLLSVTVPYAFTATVPAVAGIVIVVLCWRRCEAVSISDWEKLLRVGHRVWHRPVVVAVTLLAIWVAGGGNRLAAMAVIRTMGGDVRTERISGILGLFTWRAVWVEFEESNFSDHELNQLISQLRKVATFDYRLTLGPPHLANDKRRRLMKRLAWCNAHVHIISSAGPKRHRANR